MKIPGKPLLKPVRDNKGLLLPKDKWVEWPEDDLPDLIKVYHSNFYIYIYIYITNFHFFQDVKKRLHACLEKRLFWRYNPFKAGYIDISHLYFTFTFHIYINLHLHIKALTKSGVNR